MEQLILTDTSLTQPQCSSQLPPLDNSAIAQATPDAHWLLIRDNHELVGRCSLWWRNTPPYPKHHLGLIGHYAIQDAAAAAQLLTHACTQLATQGCTLAVAPIDGNTWRRHRLLTQRGKEPVFFLEPDNPDDWQSHFLNQGFTPFASYSSALNTNLSYVDSTVQNVSDRLQHLGVQIRSVNLSHSETELQQIYHVAIRSFRHNFLYMPITEAEFIAQYRAVLPYIQPDFVLIAEHDDRMVGFLFAVPDWLAKERGEPVNTIIIKTVAVLPERVYAGLGHWLVAHCQNCADQLGFTRAIHALMHDANPSRNLSKRYAQIMRCYTLFSKQI